MTPVLDSLAARGLRFTHARTVAPLTLPAHASILTGQWPPGHGIRVNGVTAKPGARALADRLRRAGYHTAAVVGAFVLDRRFGLAEGFDVYDDAIPRDARAADRLEAERPANVVIDRAIAILAGIATAEPWFLWVHLYDPHAPYAAPRPAAATSPYDAEVSFADAEIGRLLTTLSGRDDAGRTAVIVAGDHGEGLGEHGETTHGMLLFDATLRVPLIVVAPGVSPSVESMPVTLVDIAPTLVALAGQPADPALPGTSLLGGSDPNREIYAETDYPAAAGWHPARALVQGPLKLIASASARLFDVSADSGEQHDLASARPQAVDGLTARIQTLSRPRPQSPPSTAVVDTDTAARLRALGYVAASPAASRLAPPAGSQDAADHTHAWAQFERALSARAAGDPRRALPALAELAGRYPEAPVFLSTYAQTMAEAGQTREALRVLNGMVQRWPTDATLYHELAVVARASGQRDEALRAERAALAIDEGLPGAHNGIGLLLAEGGDHRGAAAAFEEAVGRDPSNASYLANLGNARRALGELDAARQAYQRALDRDASLVDAANGMGVILVQQQRAAEAVAWFERAIARDSGFVEAQLNLGIALQESGQRERALAQYRHVERVAPARSREQAAARTLRRQVEGR